MKKEAGGTTRRYDDGSVLLRCGVLGLLFASLLLTACGKPAVVPLPPTAGSTVAATAVPTAAGKVRVDCGTFVLSQGGRVPEAAYRCFIEAVGSGRLAELKETSLTTEGDPIPVSYLGDARGKVVMTTDSRKDSYGSQTVLRYTCTGPTVEQTWMTFKKCSPARRIG